MLHLYAFYNLKPLLHFPGCAANSSSRSMERSNEPFVLMLPGKSLDVSLLVNKKRKFRHRGGREGALNAMKHLQDDGLGKLVVKKSKGSIKV